jgi:hypothetical protein
MTRLLMIALLVSACGGTVVPSGYRQDGATPFPAAAVDTAAATATPVPTASPTPGPEAVRKTAGAAWLAALKPYRNEALYKKYR